MDFHGARDYILEKLQNELDKKLFYHNLSHTLDVHQAVLRLTQLEKIPQSTCLIIETAAFYHDSGMLIGYVGHESHSIAIVKETLPGFGYSAEEIREISNLIRVTTLPQRAVTQPEQILCDADLDSLGREDFFIQSFNLRLEWDHFNIRKTSLSEWFAFEQKFMEQHQYYTPSASVLRNEQKLKNLNEIKDLLYKK